MKTVKSFLWFVPASRRYMAHLRLAPFLLRLPAAWRTYHALELADRDGFRHV